MQENTEASRVMHQYFFRKLRDDGVITKEEGDILQMNWNDVLMISIFFEKKDAEFTAKFQKVFDEIVDDFSNDILKNVKEIDTINYLLNLLID